MALDDLHLIKGLTLKGDSTSPSEAAKNRKIIQHNIDWYGGGIMPSTAFLKRRSSGRLVERPAGSLLPAFTNDGEGIMVDEPIRICDGAGLVGANGRTRILVPSGTVSPIFILNSVNDQRVLLNGFELDCNNMINSSVPGDNPSAIVFDRSGGLANPYSSTFDPFSGNGPWAGGYADVINIQNVRVFRAPRYGIYLGCDNPSVPQITHAFLMNVHTWQCGNGLKVEGCTDSQFINVVTADSLKEGVYLNTVGNSVFKCCKSYFSGDSGPSGHVLGWNVYAAYANRCRFDYECQDGLKGGLRLEAGWDNQITGLYDNNGYNGLILSTDSGWEASGVSLGAAAHGNHIDATFANYRSFTAPSAGDQRWGLFQASESTTTGVVPPSTTGWVRAADQRLGAVNSFLSSVADLKVTTRNT